MSWIGSAIHGNEEQLRRAMREEMGLGSEDDSELDSDDHGDEEEDHVYLFGYDVPSERICASHAKRDYGGTVFFPSPVMTLKQA